MSAVRISLRDARRLGLEVDSRGRPKPRLRDPARPRPKATLDPERFASALELRGRGCWHPISWRDGVAHCADDCGA